MSIAHYIDYAVLKVSDTSRDVENACALANKYGFASICVRPDLIFDALWHLGAKTKVAVGTVVAFPLGYGCAYTKGLEIFEALRQGATEIDMVMNISRFKSKYYYQLAEEVANAKRLLKDKILKVILETSLLNVSEIKLACAIAEENGANFVKTSTGFAGGATPWAVQAMLDTVRIGVKASGGIKTREAAEGYINMGCKRIGVSSIEGIL